MRLRLLVAVVAIVAAACGSSTPDTPPPAASGGAPLPSPAGSGPAGIPGDSGEPSEEPLASDDPLPSEAASHDSPELEALLPATYDSVALARQSTTGDQALADDPSSDSIRAFLAGAGRTPQDLHFAQAYDESGQLDLVVFAFRVPGVAADKLAETLVQSALANNPNLTTTTATVGGHRVTTASDSDLGIGSYMYVHDDVVFDVETQDEEIAAQVLASLP